MQFLTQHFYQPHRAEYDEKDGNMTDEKNFSLRHARIREKKDVSACSMSFSIGQDSGYINNIESGRLMPSLTGFFI